MREPLWNLVARHYIATLQNSYCVQAWFKKNKTKQNSEALNTQMTGLSNQKLISVILCSLWLLIAAFLVLIGVLLRSLLSLAYTNLLGLGLFFAFLPL